MTFHKGTFGCLLLALFITMTGWAGRAHALTQEQALRLADGDSDSRIEALNELVAAGDATLAPYVEALLADEVKVANGKALLVQGTEVLEAGTNTKTTLPDDAEDVVNNNRMRQALEGALAAFKLFSPDRALRAKAIGELNNSAEIGRASCRERV